LLLESAPLRFVKDGWIVLTPLAPLAPLATALITRVVLMLVLRRSRRRSGSWTCPAGARPFTVGPGHRRHRHVTGRATAVLLTARAFPRNRGADGGRPDVTVGALDDRFDLRRRWCVLVHLAAAVTLVLATGFRVESLGNLSGWAPSSARSICCSPCWPRWR